MNFTLDDIRTEYARLDALMGMDTSDIKISVSTRFTRKLGMCKFSVDRHGRYTPSEIVIGAQVFDADEELFYDTIRHEYAHAIVTLRDCRNHGHDAAWKQTCLEVGCRPRATIRATDAEALHSANAESIKYIVRCTKCGHESRYYRKGKVVASLLAGKKTYRCRCGGSLELKVQTMQK